MNENGEISPRYDEMNKSESVRKYNKRKGCNSLNGKNQNEQHHQNWSSSLSNLHNTHQFTNHLNNASTLLNTHKSLSSSGIGNGFDKFKIF